MKVLIIVKAHTRHNIQHLFFDKILHPDKSKKKKKKKRTKATHAKDFLGEKCPKSRQILRIKK
jgi:hypothetical protein